MSAHPLPESVTSVIAKRIASREYPPGEALPSVRDLAEELNVSVATVRIAVAVLETLMLVETVPRVGTLVLDPDRRTGLHAWSFLGGEGDANPQILRPFLRDFLTLYAVGAVDVARDLMKLSDVSSIDLAVKRLERVVASAPNDRHLAMNAQMEVYRAVLIATDHPMYLGLMNELHFAAARVPELESIIVPDPRAMAFRWRAMMKLLPILNGSNFSRIVPPLAREGVLEVRRWFDMRGARRRE